MLHSLNTVTANERAMELLREDPSMASLVDRFGPYTWKLNTPFATLARAITGQVVSGNAAKRAYKKLKEKTSLEPPVIAEMSVEDLMAFGLNDRRAAYVYKLVLSPFT